MSEANSHILLNADKLKPEDALPKMIGDTDEEILARHKYGKDVVRELLTEFNPSKLRLNRIDYVDFPVVIDGKNQWMRIEIRAIPAKVLDEISSEYQECAASMPRAKGPDGEWDQDQSSSEFSKIAIRLMRLQRRLAYEKILEGAMFVIKDDDGKVVWNPMTREGDKDQAIHWLDYMGISEHQIAILINAIDRLSTDVAISDEEDFGKK